MYRFGFLSPKRGNQSGYRALFTPTANHLEYMVSLKQAREAESNPEYKQVEPATFIPHSS
eukprot:scaffold641_cov373-Pavlova_lutheri.AAC.7